MFIILAHGTTSTTLASIRAAASGLARDALSAALGTQRLSSGSSMQESAAAAWPLGYASEPVCLKSTRDDNFSGLH